jgi:hypothetical protein
MEMVHQEVQEIQELAVQVVHQSKWIKRCWNIRKFQEIQELVAVHQEIQELVVQRKWIMEMVHQEVQEIQELVVQVVHQEIQEWFKWFSGSSGANGLNGAGTSGVSGGVGSTSNTYIPLSNGSNFINSVMVDDGIFLLITH